MKAYSTSIKKGEGWATMLSMDNLENFPTAIGGSQTTYWCAYYWNTSGATSGFRLCLRGGSVSNGGLCGLSTLVDSTAVSRVPACSAAPLSAKQERSGQSNQCTWRPKDYMSLLGVHKITGCT